MFYDTVYIVSQKNGTGYFFGKKFYENKKENQFLNIYLHKKTNIYQKKIHFRRDVYSCIMIEQTYYEEEGEMKRRFLAGLLSAAMILTMTTVTPVGAAPEGSEEAGVKSAAVLSDEELGTNIAPKATADASYTNVWSITPASMNDGELATSDPYTSWNSWGGNDETYPVTTSLTWNAEQVITGMRVIWWADNAELQSNANVTFPKRCEVHYVDAEGNPQRITGMVNEKGDPSDEVGVVYDSSSNNGINGNNKYWNYVKFAEPITTKELQMKIERNGSGSNGVGISEWEVFGYETIASGTNVAPESKVTASYTNKDLAETAASVTVDGKLAGNDQNTTWNSAGASKEEYPVKVNLDWGEAEYNVSSMRVMWWSDNGAVKFPSDCKLQYYNTRSKDWSDVTDMVDETGANVKSVGVKFGSEGKPGENEADYTGENNRYWNGVSLNENVKTNKLRLLVGSKSASEGVGIGEIEVYGTKAAVTLGENVAPNAAASANAQNTPVTNVNNGGLADGAGSSWNTWGSNTYPTTVALTWDAPYELNGMRVMWWADNGNLQANGNVTFPKSCEVEYYDHETSSWKKITAMTDETGANVSSVGVKYGSADQASNQPGNHLNGNNRYWNQVTFDESVKTTQIRMNIDRNGSGSNGIGIGEWEVFGEEMTAEWNEMVSAQITGKDRIMKGEKGVFTAESLPTGLEGMSYKWELAEGSEFMSIEGADDQKEVTIKANESGYGKLNLTLSRKENDKTVKRTASMDIKVDGIESIDEYVTATEAGTAPILPKMVVANGIAFDDPTPEYFGPTGHDFAEEFNSKLVPVKWEEVDKKLYAKDQVGKTFEVKGKVTAGGEEFDAVAKVTVNEPVVAPVANNTVTFENVQLEDNFWNPKQKVNAVNSLNKAIAQIEQPSGGEPNFKNAIKKLNGEPYDEFQGFVFQDSDIYKSIEAISYTLSVIQNDDDPEMVAQKEVLEKKLAEWISLIEQVQYADGYIDTHFTLRSTAHAGGSSAGTHRWRDFSNHEMYNAGHFFESVVAYTRYREGIGDPDYSLYVVGKRFADEIVSLFGPEGTRHEVPGHEEVELALVKFAKLVEEYEGEGTGQKYIDTVKTLIDRRGEASGLRESGYRGGEYSQDATPIKEEVNGVGHAVRACYFYAGVTDIATLLPEGDADRDAYLNTMDNIWDSVKNRKTYITGGIGVRSHGEDFGGDYELPNNDSYCEICASIALANWNQRMNLIHEDAKYADVVERTLYNAILVGTNLTGDKFYYDTRLEVSNRQGRSDWFACACCPPNLMRTIAKLSEYMYTVHGDDLFVNLYIGSDGNVNVDGTNVELTQKTEYPWDGAVKMTVDPAKDKKFTMNIRIPGWTQEQKNKDVKIEVNGEAVKAEAENGYVAITRTWKAGDVVKIDMPMEIRMTEADPNVTTNAGRIALERGPVVYCMETAGNAQLNEGIANFKPLNLVIPRDAKLTATYNKDLLNGVVEINGDVQYNDGGTMKDAKLQAIPYYAWNNRGDDGVEGQNSCTQMLIWTNAVGEAAGAEVTISGEQEVKVGESISLTAEVEGMENPAYAWSIKEGDAVEIAEGADAATVKLNGLKEGTAVITVTATSGDVSVSADYTVTVTAAEQPAPTLESLELAGPTKVEYVQGEQLDLTGLVVTAVYSDGTRTEIPYGEGGYTVSGYDANAVGEQTVTVTYEGVSAEFTVTVKEAEQPLPTLDKIVLGGDAKTKYQQGEQLDLTGLVVTAVYSDGTTKEIPYGEGGYTVSGYDANKVGKQTITITYGGKTAEFEVTVEKKQTTDPQNPQKPNKPQKPSGSQTGNKTDAAAKTGDQANMVLPAVGLLMAAALLLMAWKRRRVGR